MYSFIVFLFHYSFLNGNAHATKALWVCARVCVCLISTSRVHLKRGGEKKKIYTGKSFHMHFVRTGLIGLSFFLFVFFFSYLFCVCVCVLFFFFLIIQQKNGRKWSTHGGCIRVVVVVYPAKKEAMTSSKLAFAPKPGTSIGTQKDLKHETPAGDDAVQLCFTPTPLPPSLIKRKSYMFFFFFNAVPRS